MRIRTLFAIVTLATSAFAHADPAARGLRTYDDALAAESAALRTRIGATDSLDDLLVARELPPWLEGTARERHDAVTPRVYERLLALHGNEPVVRHVVAGYCNRAAAAAACAGHDAIRGYADADPDNVWPWIMWAARAREDGDTVGMWWALEHAARAPRADTYDRASLRAYMRFLDRVEPPAGAPAPALADRFVVAMGWFLATDIPSFQSVTEGCPRQAMLTGTQHEWCFRIGRTLAHGSTLIEAAIGVVVMEAHARSPAERGEAEATRASHDALRQAHHLLAQPGAGAMSADEARAFDAYVADFLAVGERAALERLIVRSGYTLDGWRATVAETAPSRAK